MAESVGSIYYIVDARTQALLDAERQVDRSTRRMGRSFDRADGAIGRVNNSLGDLKTLVAAVGGALAVQKVVKYADAWTNLQNQLRQVTETEAERARVTERLMAIANETRSGIASTANLYARLTRASTELGLSEKRRMRITQTINQAFAVSGATAQEASAAITQLSQGLAAGALRGDEFNSVAEQAPAIMRAIADEANMTIGELRAFAAEGGITADLVVRSLEGAADAMDEKFARAAKSFGQNMEVANNNLTEFIGTSQAVTTAVSATGETLVILSENIETVAKFAGLAATAYGARLLSALVSSTAAWVKQTAATSANTKAEIANAQQVVRRTAAESQAARAILSTAQMEARATAGTNAHRFALEQLSIARVRATNAAAAHNWATNNATAAMSRAGVVARGLGTALAFMGGPVGAILIAVGALYIFREELGLVADQADTTKGRIEGLTRSMSVMGKTAVNSSIESVRAELQFLEDQAWNTQRAISRLGEGETFGGRTKSQLENQLESIAEDVTFARQELNKLERRKQELEGGGGGNGDGGGAPSASDDAAEKEAKRLDELRASYRRLRDELRPLEASQREYAESKATLVEYALRENMATSELQSLLADLKASYQSAQTAAEAYGNGAADASDKATQAAQDLDFAFQSAFESAIIEGENLRGVISGLAEDIARLTLRKSVTSPIAGYLSTAIGGAFRGGAVAGGWTSQIATAGYASGGYTGDGGKYEPAGIVHGGEYVVPKNVVDQPGMLGFLEQLSNTRGYLSGGYVGSSSRSGSYAGAGGETNITYAPVFQVQAQPGASEQDGQRLVKGMDTLIKSTFYKMVEKESRPGGVLNKR